MNVDRCTLRLAPELTQQIGYLSKIGDYHGRNASFFLIIRLPSFLPCFTTIFFSLLYLFTLRSRLSSN